MEITVTKQIGELVFNITGNIEGVNEAVMRVSVTKVVCNGQDVTAFHKAFAEANEIQDALRKGYASDLIARNMTKARELSEQLTTLNEEMETARRLLLNY